MAGKSGRDWTFFKRHTNKPCLKLTHANSMPRTTYAPTSEQGGEKGKTTHTTTQIRKTM